MISCQVGDNARQSPRPSSSPTQSSLLSPHRLFSLLKARRTTPLIPYYRSPNPPDRVTSVGIRPSDVQLSPHTQGDLCLRLSTGFGSVLVEDGICLGPTASHTQVDEDSLRVP